MTKFALALPLSLAIGTAFAAPERYEIDSTHTFPSFEADHQGGLSIWRGKLRSTKGTVTLDRDARNGDVDIIMDATSIDFGYDKMTDRAKAADIFDVATYPTVIYRGKISKFNGDAPAEVDGMLTLHGVTKPLKLTINSFLCKVTTTKKNVCGADASATFNRADFGVDFGQTLGFKMDIKLAIQVEAIKVE
jgi:polyisoprenoid-binding protein YceI